MDELINHFENLEFIDRMVEEDEHAIVPYFEEDEHALVPCLTRFQERNGVVLYEERSLVPFDDTYNIMTNGKLRPKVEIDDETNRVWRLLLEDINSQGIDGTDEDNTKKWEEERNIYSERAASFISRMHLIQGDMLLHKRNISCSRNLRSTNFYFRKLAFSIKARRPMF